MTNNFILKREFSAGDLIAIVTALIAVLSVYFQTKSMVEVLEIRVSRLETEDHETLKSLEKDFNDQKVEIVEIRTDVRWIRGALGGDKPKNPADEWKR